MQETSFNRSLGNDEWSQLSSMEKSLCLIYRAKLLAGNRINQALVQEMNAIHQKYPEFDVGCIPGNFPDCIQSFIDLPEDDQAVLVSYLEHINKGMNEGRYLGLAILARKILNQHPLVSMKQVEDFCKEQRNTEIRIVMDEETITYE